MRRPIRRSALARAGFTLIELLAVILIIGILMFFLLPRIPEAIDAARVTACKRNMQEVYNGLMLFQQKFKRMPRESGVRFFAELIASNTWEPVEGTARKLTCPGVDDAVLSSTGMKPEEWYTELDRIDGGYSTYAGRDMKNFPLRQFPASGKEPLVADDNDPEMNHDTTTVVLYGDGGVAGIELYDLTNEGVLAKDEMILIVGPNSPVEALRKLSLD